MASCAVLTYIERRIVETTAKLAALKQSKARCVRLIRAMEKRERLRWELVEMSNSRVDSTTESEKR